MFEATGLACRADGPTGPGKNGGNCGIGNPCNPATGNKYQVEEDYRSGDGLLNFTRHYNSQFDADIGLGFGWTSTFHKRLEVSGSNLKVRQATGRDEPFTCSGLGHCTGDPDTKLLLSQDTAGYRLTLGDGAAERYDTNGRLLSETDRSGNTTSYSYDATGHLQSVTGPFGHRLTFAYDTNGHLITMTDPADGLYQYAYDANANLVRVVYPDDASRTYHYENNAHPHHLTGITDENGVRFANFAYDANGKATLTEHAGGQERFTLAYESDTQTRVADAIGTARAMTFEEKLGLKNLLSDINQTDGKGVTQEFDSQNNLIRRTDEEGRTTVYTYNAQNQRLSMTEAADTPDARTTIFGYLAADIDLPISVLTPSVAPGQVKQVTTTYDADRNPIQITQSGFTPTGAPISRTLSMEYNALGQIIRIDGPRLDVVDITVLEYYECTDGAQCGQLRRITNALGHATSYDAYDAHGRVTRLTDPNGIVTTFTYDSRGRLRAVTQTPSAGASRVTVNNYDAAGQLQTATTPDGVTLTYGYDAAHNLRTITDNLGHRIEYDYDSRGNRIAERTLDPGGTLIRSVEQSYDLRNYLSQIDTSGSLTQRLHDTIGNLLSQTDPNNNPPTAHNYDALNRLFQTVDGLSGVTAYSYDVNDRITRITVPNSATTQYAYDDLSNLLQEISPDRGTLTYTHDAAGNVISMTDARGIRVTYGYDAINRLATIDYPGTDEDVSFTYDACANGIGRLCSVQDQSGTTSYAYDPFGNMTQQTKTELGVTYTTGYTYDAGDRVTSMTYPDERVVAYTRDVVGRITRVATSINNEPASVLVEGITYRADGLISTQTFGNGLEEVRQYDSQGRLTYQSLGSADTRLYSYDPNGNLIERQTLPQVGTYRYDALDRLAGETLANDEIEVLGYIYDANGNRLTRSVNGKTQTYRYASTSNRLEGINRQEIILDAAGNTVSDRNGKREFEYNQAGRLARLTRDGKLRGVYTYNFQGQRSRKVRTNKNGVTKIFLYHYDVQGNLIAETREDGKPIRDYVWLEGAPIAQIETRENKRGVLRERELLYLHTDHLNTPRLASDATQTVLWRWEGDAFGEIKPDKDPDEDEDNTNVRLRFPGQYHDGESGLYYNWNRYYDPKTGRYIQFDPIGIVRGIAATQVRTLPKAIRRQLGIPWLREAIEYGVNQPYAYVLNNPLVTSDQYGLVYTICANEPSGGDLPKPPKGGRDIRCVLPLPGERLEPKPGMPCPLGCDAAYLEKQKNCYTSCGGPLSAGTAACLLKWKERLQQCVIDCD